MWLKIIQSFLVILGAFIFQAAVVPHISIAGAKPDVILIIAALYGFMYGPSAGSLAGFTGGLLGDLLIGSHVGLDLLSKSIVGFFAGLVQRTIFIENILLPMLAIFVATGLNEFIYIGFMLLLGEAVPLKLLIVKTILPSALYNSLLTPFIYLAAHRFMVFKQETPLVSKL
ncbi:MAG: rod shape-determining protein MreD [Actinobacteria bacterium]|nr:rod shape-determining protein MreD [Actinomycetota bacterium]